RRTRATSPHRLLRCASAPVVLEGRRVLSSRRMALPGAADACQFCGKALALGAVACFRCGKMVEREAPGTTGSGQLPTGLGTQAKGELLENQWRLIRQIGQGAAGVVWQGADVGLDRPVAVK